MNQQASSDPVITFHGAAGTVTGSCMELRHGGHGVLIDCGLFQGTRTLEALNWQDLPFDPAKIDAVILTHAHIDHSGQLPRLVKNGYAGPIFCTQATRDLLYHMLPDAGRIQEGEAERRNRRTDRADVDAFQPIYTEADGLAAWEQCVPVDLCDWFEPAPGFRTRLWNAGHILGSTSVEMELAGRRLLFSGDLGPDHKAFHPDPDAPSGLDHVVCESTYGDRTRDDIDIAERRDLLEQEIRTALARGGNLVVPVFALERTQELLLDIAMLINAGRLPHPRVFIDSPLATRATEVFARHERELEDMGDGEVFRHPSFHYVASATESMRLNQISGAIILSASGMCEAGRIRHHLRHNLVRRDSTVLFVGFQAGGTLGRALVDGAERVRISGTDVPVRAQIRRIDSYSAHADRDDLLRWIAARQPVAGTLFLTHGEAQATAALAEGVRAASKDQAVAAPRIGESYALPAGGAAKRLTTGREDLMEAATHDWQNDYAAFATRLKADLRAIEDANARREALARMAEILRSYREHKDSKQARRKPWNKPKRR